MSSNASATLAARLAPLAARWNGLPLRDRRALLALGGFFGAVGIWLLVVAPVMAWSHAERERLVSAQDDLAWMTANANAARRAAQSGSGQLPAGQSLLSAVNASARASGLNLQRFDPDGERRVRVTLENAVFTDVMRWVVDLERRYGLVVESFNADNQAQPGVVNIRLTLGLPS